MISLLSNYHLLKKTSLPHYPSSSAIEFYNNKLYVIGDDATHMLVLDVQHKMLDSVKLFNGSKSRLSKDEKADIEAMAIVQTKGKDYLLATSSFSTEERNSLLFMPIGDLKNVEANRKNKMIKEFKKAGFKTLNIEGMAVVGDKIILANRANEGSRQNHLIVVNESKKVENITPDNIHILNIPTGKNIIGLSGLTYLPERDLLLFTASTEETGDAYSDGAIGESYLGYITEFSKKMKTKNITADKLMPLSKILNNGLQKIESVCVEFYKDSKAILHLAADNDNGESTLFKITLDF